MQQPEIARRLRRRAGELSRTYNIARRWSRPTRQPPRPDTLGDTPLYALLATWCEEDVIASTVSNAFEQGCERVFIIDNDSPDDTVLQATSAGAEVARVYKTEYYDEDRRMTEIREVMQEISEASAAAHLWWMTCDADEFVHGPRGLTVAGYLAGLDKRFRVVGARVFNHYPDGEPANVPGFHPLDFQPLCQEVRVAWCSLRHWKHPLVRWDRHETGVWPGNGFHRTAPSRSRVNEPVDGVFMHHFQYRERAATFARLQRLCEPSKGAAARTALQDQRGGESGAMHRFRTLDHVYEGDWSRVPLPSVNRPHQGVDLKPWSEQVPPADAAVPRWYRDDDANRI